MLMRLRLPLVTAAVLVGLAGLPNAAPAQSSAPPEPTYAAISGEESPTWRNPSAHASCPFCVFLAVNAIRAAVVMRAAAAARAVVIAAKAAREASKLAQKVTRARIRRVQAESRVISRRSKSWVKKKWPGFKTETKVCLSSIATVKTAGYLEDGQFSRDEFSSWNIFNGMFISQVELLTTRFPMRVDPNEIKRIGKKAAAEIFACGVGLAWSWKYRRSQAPTPQ